MTVKELMDKLACFGPDLQVVIYKKPVDDTDGSMMDISRARTLEACIGKFWYQASGSHAQNVLLLS